MNNTNINTNRLIKEKSPYLLQHAYNPVNWYPWCEEAFSAAKEENKMIFLSIGYSTCHWCHVMEKESFEDTEVANLLNESFICIKVDREERPDIDNIYMNVCQIITSSGGWPLTIILTSDRKPFYVDTYIPKTDSLLRQGLMGLVPKLNDLWNNHREKIINSSDEITKVLIESQKKLPGEKINENIIYKAYKILFNQFDDLFGGFGNAPKFPGSHNLIFLLRYWKKTGDIKALEMVEKTLKAMRFGGIFDHIGYGFHRYSTDNKWLLPHFEKMLYDQAMLSLAYIEAFEATKDEFYANTAKEIFEYVLRSLRGEEKAFYSGEDADSENKEGIFYLWNESEINSALTEEESKLFKMRYNITPDGNIIDEITHNKTGKNLPYLKNNLEETFSSQNSTFDCMKNSVQQILRKLFYIREKRTHPGKDDKILTDWNGLMIAALAKGGKVFHDDNYIQAAKEALEFIFNKLQSNEGLLYHCYRDNSVSKISFIDDYSFIIFGLLELYEATFQVEYLKRAISLNKTLIKHYWDEISGGFYFTADYNEEILLRKKEYFDSAIPSGNSIAMINLLRLARITSDFEYENKAIKIALSNNDSLSQFPHAHTQMLTAIEYLTGKAYEIIICVNNFNEEVISVIKKLNSIYLPNKVVLLQCENEKDLTIINESIKAISCNEDNLTIYICTGYGCRKPVNNLHEAIELLSQ
ncbi:MAG: thioredoxin domain-containing protein [Cyanobacteriota bacterium]